MRKILFCDRDGTLIEEPADFQVDSISKVKLMPNVIPTLLSLRAQGYDLVMITNQDGLGTESFPQKNFQEAHDFVLDLFTTQGISFSDQLICPHFARDQCDCRKPAVGLLDSYLKKRDIDWNKSFVIGDRESDMELASNLGIAGVLLNDECSWLEVQNKIRKKTRTIQLTRNTEETRIDCELVLDGTGQSNINTGILFFDHMLEQLAKHSLIDLNLSSSGDIAVDDHHTVEDVALVLGEAIRSGLGDKRGIERFGFVLPMDECLAQVSLDLSGRPYSHINIPFTRDTVGQLSTEMITHFFKSFANALGANLHIQVSSGNNHHMAESSFKALAKTLKQAVTIVNPSLLQSTKGVLA